MNKKVCIVIPSRLASSRLPEKPLLVIGGRTMIQRVYEQATKVKLSSFVIVATDHISIYNHVKSFGGEVIMTSDLHKTGTDRVGEVMELLPDYDIYINCQGDEPFINPDQIDQLIANFENDEIEIATQFSPCFNYEIFNYNVVKLTTAKNNKVLYFSRQAIPSFRDLPYNRWAENYNFKKHIGLYGFTKNALQKIINMPSSQLEDAESLEQLRWLENGLNVYAFHTDYNSKGIDTLEDYEMVKHINE